MLRQLILELISRVFSLFHKHSISIIVISIFVLPSTVDVVLEEKIIAWQFKADGSAVLIVLLNELVPSGVGAAAVHQDIYINSNHDCKNNKYHHNHCGKPTKIRVMSSISTFLLLHRRTASPIKAALRL